MHLADLEAIRLRVTSALAQWERRSHVLLVENDSTQVTQFVAFAAIQSPQLEIVPFSNGPAALQFAEHQPVDAAVLDCLLAPPMDGPEVAAKLHARQPAAKLIMATAHLDDDFQFREQVTRAQVPVEAWYEKPVHLPVLVKATAHAAQKKRLTSIHADIMKAFAEATEVHAVARHEGEVIGIARDWSTIQFACDVDADACRQFPTWRLQCAGADRLGVRVEHEIGRVGDSLLSRLRLVSGQTAASFESGEAGDPTDEQFAALENDDVE